MALPKSDRAVVKARARRSLSVVIAFTISPALRSTRNDHLARMKAANSSSRRFAW